MNTFCSYYNQKICSSCKHLEVPYETQIQHKSDQLTKLIPQLNSSILQQPVFSNTQGFRNKAKFSVTGNLEHPIIGLTGETELDQGREILACPVHHPKINELAKSLPEFIQLTKLTPYQIKTKSGELKGIIIYYSSDSDEFYLRLVVRSKESIDRIRKHASILTNRFPALSCFSVNIQPVPHAILEGEEEIFISAKNAIHHQLGKLGLSLHPQGFVQTNQAVALSLYQTAASWIRELKPKTFVELFSGQGAFSFFIQEVVEQAVGIEINPEAVKRANATALENGWTHLHFLAADAAKVKDQVQALSPEVLLVNPPRRGLGEAVELMKELRPKTFIYSSCNAETLASDAQKLGSLYKISRAQMFDMFPHTEHFETLVLFELI